MEGFFVLCQIFKLTQPYKIMPRIKVDGNTHSSHPPACACSAPEQTSHHILYECPELGPPGDGNVDLANPTLETINWVRQLGEVA